MDGCEDILDVFLQTKDANGNHSRPASHTLSLTIEPTC
jgi:hypothetical protein